jgi:N6-L-threonylcarbamoyladenine synthase
VAVNQSLQHAMTERCSQSGISVLWPPPVLCTDNGGMIACVGHHYLSQNLSSPLSLPPAPSQNL